MTHKERGRSYHSPDSQPPPHPSRSYSETRGTAQHPHSPRPLPHRDERPQPRQSYNAQSRHADALRPIPSSELGWDDIKPPYVQNITQMYYDGEGTRAWRLKYQERAGFRPRRPPTIPGPPRRVILVCYVTIKGKRIVSNRKLHYYTGQNDKYLVGRLNKAYRLIKDQAPCSLSRALSLISIGAVEFQTWKQFGDDRPCRLSDVESIPKEANRTNMSVFAYQFKNPGDGSSWTGQFDTVIQEARQIHVNAPDKFFVLVHIIEMLNMRILYIAFIGALALSIASGTTYGALTARWGDAFTLAGLILAVFSFVCALVALTEVLGIEVPIFSTGNMHALDAREVAEWLESGHRRP